LWASIEEFYITYWYASFYPSLFSMLFALFNLFCSLQLAPIIDTLLFADVPLCLGTLILLKWKDEGGRQRRFRLMNKVAFKWRHFGLLFKQEVSDLDGWEKQYLGDNRRCWEKVMGEWLDGGGTDEYPDTWEGLVRVLEDVEYTEIARELVRVLRSEIDSPPVQMFAATLTTIPQVPPPPPPPCHPYLTRLSSPLNPTLSLLSSHYLPLRMFPSPQQLLLKLMLPQVKPPPPDPHTPSPSPPPSP
jgi:hypothetical protein